jgi:hypothetical protein
MKLRNDIRRKRPMKLSVFGEYVEFTVVVLKKTRFRIRLMKFSTLGENAE